MVSAAVASLRRRCQRGVMENLCVAACVRQLTEVVAGMQLSRGTTPSLPFAYAPALSPPSLPVFAAVVDARRAELCARAMRGLGGSSTLQQKGEGVRRKIHWMAAPNPSPSCGGGGGGGGGGTTMSLLLLSRSRKRRKHSGVSFLLWPRSFSRMARFVHFSALTRNSGAFNCSRLLTL